MVTISIKRALKTLNGSKVVKRAPVWDCTGTGSLKIARYIFLNLAVSGASVKWCFLLPRARVQGTPSAYPDGGAHTFRLYQDSFLPLTASPQVSAPFRLSCSFPYLLIHLEKKLSRAQDVIVVYFGLVGGFASKEVTTLAWFLGQCVLFRTQANPGLHLACASRCAALHSPSEVYKG